MLFHRQQKLDVVLAPEFRVQARNTYAHHHARLALAHQRQFGQRERTPEREQTAWSWLVAQVLGRDL